MATITAILAFLVVISVLVVFHEFGHYIVARWCGVEVLRFSVGFGRPLWTGRFAGSTTEWRIGCLPLGGYVQMLEDNNPSRALSEDQRKRSFDGQSLFKRSMIVLAGPVFNLLLAVLLFALAMMSGMPGIRAVVADALPGSAVAEAGLLVGDEIVAVEQQPLRDGLAHFSELLLQAVLDGREEVEIGIRKAGGGADSQLILQLHNVDLDQATRGGLLLQLGLVPQSAAQMAVVGEVFAASPAETAGLDGGIAPGLLRGDRIVMVNGGECYLWRCLVEETTKSLDKDMELGILRDGHLLTAIVRPQMSGTEDPRPMLGIRAMEQDVSQLRELHTTVYYPPLEALALGVRRTIDTSVLSLQVLGRMLRGDISTKALSGPVAIAYYSGKAAVLGLAMIFTFMAIVSVGLGVINLLPIPVLDGGYLVYFLLEWVRGRPLPMHVQRYGQLGGVAILASLFVLVTYNDLKLLFL